MAVDVFEPQSWDGFFTMVGGGSAALTGLVFVAVSLNRQGMTSATHKYRSINTLAGLTAVFTRCGLVLMANQGHIAVGLELSIVAMIGAVIFLHGFLQAFRSGGTPSAARLVTGAGLYLAEIVGAGVLISGSIVGLYVAATAMVVNVAFMTSAAWLLVVGVYNPRPRN